MLHASGRLHKLSFLRYECSLNPQASDRRRKRRRKSEQRGFRSSMSALLPMSSSTNEIKASSRIVAYSYKWNCLFKTRSVSVRLFDVWCSDPTMSTMAKDDPIPVDNQSIVFRQIVDSSPELLHTARPDGYVDFFNQTWLDFTGMPLEKLLGWGWTCRIHPDDVEAFVQKMGESFAKGKSFQGISRVRRDDGVYRWMLHRKVPRFDGDGKLIKWHGSSWPTRSFVPVRLLV
jgi:PAS domain S-box-containing protein